MIKTELNKECGIRLKECLSEFPMTQNELASLTGYTQQYISNIIVGKKPMTIKAAKLFAEHLQVRESYLLCEDNFKTEEDEMDYYNRESISGCHRIIDYLKTLGITIMPVMPYPTDKEVSDSNISTLKEHEIGLIDGKNKKYRLFEIPQILGSMHKNMNAFIYQFFPDDSLLLFSVKINNVYRIINVNEFGCLLKEIDSFVHFAVTNFLDNHIQDGGMQENITDSELDESNS